MKKYTLVDTSLMSWTEFGEVIESLIAKIQVYAEDTSIVFDAVAPILRNGAIPGTMIANKLQIITQLPIQVKYNHPNIQPEQLLPFYKPLTHNLRDEPNILITECNTFSGKSALIAAEIILANYPKAHLFYATIAKVYRSQAVEYPHFEKYFYGVMTNENFEADESTQLIVLKTGDDTTLAGLAPKGYYLTIKAMSDEESVEQYVLHTDDMLAVAGWMKVQFPDAKLYWLGLSAYSHDIANDFITTLPSGWKIIKTPATSWAHERSSTATYDLDPISVLDMLAAEETKLVASEYDAIELNFICRPFAKGEQPTEGSVPSGINPQQHYMVEMAIVSGHTLDLAIICPKGVKSSWGWRHYAKDVVEADRLLHAQRLNNALITHFFTHFDGEGKSTPGITLLDNNLDGMANAVRLIVGDIPTGPLLLAPESWWSSFSPAGN